MAAAPRTWMAWRAAGLAGGLATLAAAQTQTVQISLQGSSTPISPYIYGANEWCNAADVPFTATRWGGNRQTGYNWETNASSAGSDYIHNSDNHLVMNLPLTEQKQPARAVEKLHQTFTPRKQYIQATVQIAGYVAADMNGTVSEAETAPSARWRKVVFEKTGALSLTPNLSDGEVYMDEFVNYVASKVGKSSGGGIRAWSLDNEPGLWRHTHSRIHPGALNVGPMIEKSAGAARAIKKIDPDAEVYGPAAWGWTEFKVLDDQGDWKSAYGNRHDSWISTYLALMKAEGDKAGKRLLDVLDIHWYPEHQGECRIIMNGCDQNSAAQAEARVQAPRSLWDDTFVEKSWIGQANGNKPIKLLGMMKASIAEQYPGTRLAITEYEYGGHDHWSGGLAQADVLGIFGREGVYMATLWSQPGRYTKSAFKVFLDYDGQGGRFGDLSVPAAAGNRAALSVFASLDTKDATKLRIVAINKTATAQSTQFTLPGGTFTSGTVYGFDEASGGAITSRGSITGLTPGSFTYSLPPRSVLHFVLTGSPVAVNTGLAPALHHRSRAAFPTFLSGGLPVGRDGSTRILSVDGRMGMLDPDAGRSRTPRVAAGRYLLE